MLRSLQPPIRAPCWSTQGLVPGNSLCVSGSHGMVSKGKHEMCCVTSMSEVDWDDKLPGSVLPSPQRDQTTSGVIYGSDEKCGGSYPPTTLYFPFDRGEIWETSARATEPAWWILLPVSRRPVVYIYGLLRRAHCSLYGVGVPWGWNPSRFHMGLVL